MHCMLDMETLGVSHDSVILTIGAVKFSPYDLLEPHTPLYLKLDFDEQLAAGRIVNESTIEWWSKQDKAIYEEAMGDDNRVPIIDCLKQLNKFFVGIDKLWSQGAFDFNILENLYKQFGQPVPWQFYQLRDSRTVLDMGDSSAKTGNKVAHNALADAYSQAVAVQRIYKQCGVTKK